MSWEEISEWCDAVNKNINQFLVVSFMWICLSITTKYSKTVLQFKITVYYYYLKIYVFLWWQIWFFSGQSSMSHDPEEIILIWLFGAQIIIGIQLIIMVLIIIIIISIKKYNQPWLVTARNNSCDVTKAKLLF